MSYEWSLPSRERSMLSSAPCAFTSFASASAVSAPASSGSDSYEPAKTSFETIKRSSDKLLREFASAPAKDAANAPETKFTRPVEVAYSEPSSVSPLRLCSPKIPVEE
jgi:hypothetical protein